MDALKHYHPAVAFCFFLLMIILSLASMQPVFQCVSFVAAVSYAIAVSGLGSFIRGTWWIALLILVVTLFNSVFGGRGLTVLLTLGVGDWQTFVTAESMFYGFIMGLMLANVILWFNVLGKVSSMQGFIEMFSRISPTAGMMLARITVFIPELTNQARLIDRAQRTFFRRTFVGKTSEGQSDVSLTEGGREGALLSSTALASDPNGSFVAELVATDAPDSNAKRSRKGQLAYASALSSHLMEWGMEKSLITANSMLARGYGSRRRTSFRRTKLTPRDLVPLIAILVLGATSLVCIIWAGMEYQFYPYLSPIEIWWGYIPFLVLCLIPLLLQLGEELAWWQSR